jgi:hypothetical protein
VRAFFTAFTSYGSGCPLATVDVPTFRLELHSTEVPVPGVWVAGVIHSVNEPRIKRVVIGNVDSSNPAFLRKVASMFFSFIASTFIAFISFYIAPSGVSVEAALSLSAASLKTPVALLETPVASVAPTAHSIVCSSAAVKSWE